MTVLWAITSTGLEAQGTTATVRINLPVTEVVTRLEMSSAVTDFGTVSSNELISGSSETAGPVMQVTSNRAVTVTIAADAANFGPAGKASGEVGWAPHSGGPYSDLTTGGATVLSLTPGGQASQPLFFRIDWALTDPPGLYQLDLTFTVSVP